MSILGVLFLVSPLANLHIDIAKAIPEVQLAISREQVVKAIIKDGNNDEPDLDILHFLGRARAYGFQEINFVIRASSREHAHSILEEIVNRFNAAEDVQERHREGMGLFKFSVFKDEASNTEIHDFVNKSSGELGAILFVDGSSILTT